jgi:hypothetical protein
MLAHLPEYRIRTCTSSALSAYPLPEEDLPSQTFFARDALWTNLARRSFGAGEVTFRPGDAAGRYYVVIEGEVEVRGEGCGADQTVTRVSVGQMFGDQPALRGQRGAMTAHAVEPTVLLEVAREAEPLLATSCGHRHPRAGDDPVVGPRVTLISCSSAAGSWVTPTMKVPSLIV